MKAYLLIYFISALLLTSCLYKINKKEYKNISITIDYAVYNKLDTVYINVKNRSGQYLYYFIGLESFVNNEWREIDLDITGNVDQAATIHELPDKKSKKYTYDLKEISDMQIENNKLKLRLRLDCFKSIESLNKANSGYTDEKIYSSDFTVQP